MPGISWLGVMNNEAKGEMSVFGEKRRICDNIVFKGNGTRCAFWYLRPPRSMKVAFLCLSVCSHFSSIITYNSFPFLVSFHSDIQRSYFWSFPFFLCLVLSIFSGGVLPLVWKNVKFDIRSSWCHCIFNSLYYSSWTYLIFCVCFRNLSQKHYVFLLK